MFITSVLQNYANKLIAQNVDAKKMKIIITALPCSALLYPALLRSTLLGSALPCPTLLYSTQLYSALLCPALPCSALLYSTQLNSTLPYPSQSHHRVLICFCADAALPYRPRIVDMPLRRDSRREVAEGIGFRLLSEKIPRTRRTMVVAGVYGVDKNRVLYGCSWVALRVACCGRL